MSELISVTSETVDTTFPELPRLVRLALGFGSQLQHGTLDVTLADGRVVRLGGNAPGPAAAMKIYDYGFASRLLRGGDIGIAEAYLRGEWDTPDLTQFLYLFCVNQDWMQSMQVGNPLTRTFQVVRHWLNRNTRRQARRNIYAHYDIGNAFYSAWLDPSMTYSSALFEDDTADLTAAQHNKYRRLAEAIDLRPGQKLLEIGCGWGGFAEYAAKTFGTKVVGLTISKEQRDFAQARIHNAGLSDQVEIRLQDYRDEQDRYDRIASIEMIEAVGEQFWPKYFSQLRDRLLPGGLAGITITIQDSLFQTYRREVDFIQRYVFRAACCLAAILKTLGECFGVPVIRERRARLCQTLAIWRSNFRAAWPNLTPAGFDDLPAAVEYYLAHWRGSCRKYRRRQVVFAKSADSPVSVLAYVSGGPLGRQRLGKQTGNFKTWPSTKTSSKRSVTRPHQAERASELTGCTILGKAEFMIRPVGQGPRGQVIIPKSRSAATLSPAALWWIDRGQYRHRPSGRRQRARLPHSILIPSASSKRRTSVAVRRRADRGAGAAANPNNYQHVDGGWPPSYRPSRTACCSTSGTP